MSSPTSHFSCLSRHIFCLRSKARLPAGHRSCRFREEAWRRRAWVGFVRVAERSSLRSQPNDLDERALRTASPEGERRHGTHAKEFAKVLLYYMDRLKISAKEIADALRVQQSTVSQWKDGKKSPTKTHVIALVRFFDHIKNASDAKQLSDDIRNQDLDVILYQLLHASGNDIARRPLNLTWGTHCWRNYPGPPTTDAEFRLADGMCAACQRIEG